MSEEMKDKGSRRDFMKKGAVLFVGAAAAARNKEAMASVVPSGPAGQARSADFTVPRLERVRVGFVGVGGMGSAHLTNYLNIDNVDIKAVCDIVPDKVERARKLVVKAGQPEPAGYSKGPWDFKRMCENEELDLVMNATPWEWHVPVCVAAMKSGKHAATEVPAAVTFDECWELVETAEKTRKHCVMMENCCYDRQELITLNMVRKGLLGEVLHAECGYRHDLRGVKFSNEGEGLWRRQHAWKNNGNLYPTHGLGPVAQCLNINRGDAFGSLVSMSSPSRGLQEYAREHFGPDSPQARERFALGDVNTSLIMTRLGKTIIVMHDTNLPRPYSRVHIVQGTKGLVRKWPHEVYVEGRSPFDEWEPFDKYAPEFEHPLWAKLAARGEGRGHGGMDFIEDYRLIECLRTGTPLDYDVYDAAAWSVVTALSERSVAAKGKPQEFPDFTRGLWKTNKPLGIIGG